MSLLKKTKRNQLNLLRNNLEDIDDSKDLILDHDLLISYRRPNVIKNKIFDEEDYELSDYVKLRLFLARAIALQKYEEIWG